jgi:hypothetical protein
LVIAQVTTLLTHGGRPPGRPPSDWLAPSVASVEREDSGSFRERAEPDEATQQVCRGIACLAVGPNVSARLIRAVPDRQVLKRRTTYPATLPSPTWRTIRLSNQRAIRRLYDAAHRSFAVLQRR